MLGTGWERRVPRGQLGVFFRSFLDLVGMILGLLGQRLHLINERGGLFVEIIQMHGLGIDQVDQRNSETTKQRNNETTKAFTAGVISAPISGGISIRGGRPVMRPSASKTGLRVQTDSPDHCIAP